MLYCYILFIILFICGLVRWVYTCLKIMICDGDGWRVWWFIFFLFFCKVFR